MSDEKKPDGWVAWHPERGVIAYADLPKTKEDAEETACMQTGHYYDEAYNIGSHDIDAEGLAQDGWRIRPVKLTFLDEEPKS